MHTTAEQPMPMRWLFVCRELRAYGVHRAYLAVLAPSDGSEVPLATLLLPALVADVVQQLQQRVLQAWAQHTTKHSVTTLVLTLLRSHTCACLLLYAPQLEGCSTCKNTPKRSGKCCGLLEHSAMYAGARTGRHACARRTGGSGAAVGRVQRAAATLGPGAVQRGTQGSRAGARGRRKPRPGNRTGTACSIGQWQRGRRCCVRHLRLVGSVKAL